MGDRTYAEIQIGGKIDRLLLPLLMGAFDNAGATPGDETGMDEWTVESFDAAYSESDSTCPMVLMGYDSEANYGEVGDVAKFCREWGLNFRQDWSAGCSFVADFEIFIDGKDIDTHREGDGIHLHYLVGLSQSNPDMTISEVMATLELPTLPPLEIVEGTLTPEQIAKLPVLATSEVALRFLTLTAWTYFERPPLSSTAVSGGG